LQLDIRLSTACQTEPFWIENEVEEAGIGFRPTANRWSGDCGKVDEMNLRGLKINIFFHVVSAPVPEAPGSLAIERTGSGNVGASVVLGSVPFRSDVLE
jgi:hypothetical protein